MGFRCVRTTRRLGDEGGSHIVEVSVASMVMAVAIVGIAGSMTSGMQIIGGSRQKSAGVSVAQERLERARNIAYDDVALKDAPSHVPDQADPDNAVSTDGSSYRLADGSQEPLIVETTNGGLKHLDDPFTLGSTRFSVHQYVTWVNDPGITGDLDYKRVTVVVTWKFPVASGPSNRIAQSTFIGAGSVEVPAATPAATATPTPVPSPTGTPPLSTTLGTGRPVGPLGLISASPNLSGPCPLDVLGPQATEMSLLSGSGTEAGHINSTTVQLSLSVVDLCGPITAQLANATTAEDCVTDNEGFVEVETAEAFTGLTVAWTVAGGDGAKAICAVFEDGGGNQSLVWGLDLVLDQTPPTVPASFRHVGCTLRGTDRVLSFQWNTASDEHLLGYRLYRSVDATPFTTVSSTPSLAGTNTSLKSYSSVRYVVRAYDKSGTESPDSTVLSYAKNSC